MAFQPPSPARKNIRRYPRAAVSVKAKLFAGSDRSRSSFEATLNTRDISVGGIFFESTFFLKTGQTLDVELRLPPQDRLVRARGKVVRVETKQVHGKPSGGFAIRFDEYFDESDVVLANYFMDHVLRKFITEYGKRKRIRYAQEDVDQLVDVLASWELHRNSDEEGLWGARR